jgi:alpha-L-arabinofuranosidase
MCDPDIELVVCGSCATELPTYLEWDRKVLEHCRDDVDYLSLHRYVGNHEGDTEGFLAVTNSIDEQIEATNAVCHAVYQTRRTKKKIKLSFDEWNVWYRARDAEHVDGKGKFAPHLLEEEYNLEDALVVAGFLNSFIRHADSVKIANLAQVVNVIAPILTRGDELLKQSIYYAIEMYANRRDGIALQVQVDGPSYLSKKYGRANYLDASAILDGDKLHVFAVNRNLSDSMDLNIKVADAWILGLDSAQIVTGKDAKATNTYEEPGKVVSSDFDDVSVCQGRAIVSLPALSVFAGTFRLQH